MVMGNGIAATYRNKVTITSTEISGTKTIHEHPHHTVIHRMLPLFSNSQDQQLVTRAVSLEHVTFHRINATAQIK